MRFSWLDFVVKHHITYVQRSPNVARNHIAVRCPFCGGSDPSEHMGLSLDTERPYWGCLRNNRHRGRNPLWLIQRLLGCTLERAREAMGVAKASFSDNLQTEVAKLSAVPQVGFRHFSALGTFPLTRLSSWGACDGTKVSDDDDRMAEDEELIFPKSIKPINGKGYSRDFLDYLETRGFPDPRIPAKLADLHYSVTGRFKYRLIFPIRMSGLLATYTGRDITGRASVRYLTLSSEDEIISIKHCFLFEDSVAMGGEVLFLCEGPLDALKLNCYLQPGHVATCFFGMPTLVQVAKLLHYARMWKLVCILLDSDAALQQHVLYRTLQQLAFGSPFVTLRLPKGAKDPGQLSGSEVRLLAKQALR